MATSVLVENSVAPSAEYLQGFFSEQPTDLRFSKVEYEQIIPHSALDMNSHDVTFVLDTKEPPFCYLIGDMLMKATIIMTKKDGKTLPDKKKVVGPVNNVLSSIFRSCIMRINDTTISFQPDYFNYKNYISTLLSYPVCVKSTQLEICGWDSDRPQTQSPEVLVPSLGPTSENTGFQKRSVVYRKGNQVVNDYRPGVNVIKNIYDRKLLCW